MTSTLMLCCDKSIRAVRWLRQAIPRTWPTLLFVSLGVSIGYPGHPAALAQLEPPLPIDERGLAGAQLRTDPELESVIRRADQYASIGQYVTATHMWQGVLDTSGDNMLTRDGRIYRSVALEVEGTIRNLPPDCLRIYRLQADGKAATILAARRDGHEEDALAEVTRRFFLSSLGDEAAYELACRAVDRYDFVEASRLLIKLLEEYPDSDIPKSDILIRLALINGRLGDTTTAEQFLAEFEEAVREESTLVRENVTTQIRDDIARNNSATVITLASNDWPLDFGDASRQGRMQAVRGFPTARHLNQQWSQHFSAIPLVGLSSHVRTIQSRWGGQAGGLSVASDASGILRRWRSGGGTPAGQVLLSKGRLYYKTPTQLMCVDATTGKPHWEGRTNAFGLDSQTQAFIMFSAWGGERAGIRSLRDVFVLGDRVNQGMSIVGDVIYSLEGKLGEQPSQPSVSFDGYPTVPPRERRNWISAYHAESGKFQWRIPADSEMNDWDKRSFLAAPTPYAQLLLVPVTENGSLWLYGLSQIDGSTVWRTCLCDEPAGGCRPWSTLVVSLDGGEAYVATGAGVVLAVDARSGTVRWAVRYPRYGSSNNMLQNTWGSDAASFHEFDNWHDDVVIPFGRSLVIMASDSNRVFAIDRRSCEILWESPLDPLGMPARYCLGVSGHSLYVAGPQVVRRYEITSESGEPSGRLVWNVSLEELGGSFGRGILTDEAIYLPIKDSVARIDLESGEITAQLGIAGGDAMEDEPIGNLYSDGERILVVNPGHVFAIMPASGNDNDTETP